MRKNKMEKVKPARKDFAERLAIKLRNIGEVDEGALGDDSGRWVCLKIGQRSVNFCFDMKGEVIDKIGIYQEVWQMVDDREILSFKKQDNKQK